MDAIWRDSKGAHLLPSSRCTHHSAPLMGKKKKKKKESEPSERIKVSLNRQHAALLWKHIVSIHRENPPPSLRRYSAGSFSNVSLSFSVKHSIGNNTFPSQERFRQHWCQRIERANESQTTHLFQNGLEVRLEDGVHRAWHNAVASNTIPRQTQQYNGNTSNIGSSIPFPEKPQARNYAIIWKVSFSSTFYGKKF